MTSNRSFKQRVRERMARTGETYTTARAHLLRDHHVMHVVGLLPGWQRTGGLQPDLAATANALAHVGARRADGTPLDEVDVLGLSGGIGFMYAVFEWEGHGPTLTITTRTDSMPDVTVAHVLSRAGIQHEVLITTGAAAAQRHLKHALTSGRPTLASVDEFGLPTRRPDEPPEGALPRVVGLIGHHDDVVLIDDQDPDPVAVSAMDLAAARAALRGSKHRLVVLGDPTPGHDHDAALRSSLRRTVDDYDTPPARPFASNVGTAGLEKWARLLTAGGAKSWSRVFDRPAWRAMAYHRTVECINEDLTAPGAGRGLWAAFVDRAADQLRLPVLKAVADEARDAERQWVALADLAGSADPDADPVPVFAAMADLVADLAVRERAMLDRLADALA